MPKAVCIACGLTVSLREGVKPADTPCPRCHARLAPALADAPPPAAVPARDPDEFVLAPFSALPAPVAPRMARPSAPVPGRRGRPACLLCGGEMRKGKTAEGGAWGCLLCVLGLLLAFPTFGIGLLLVLYGIHCAMRRKGVWRCSACAAEAPRKIAWYELG